MASRVALCAAAVLVPVMLAACGSTTGPGATGAASTGTSPSASASASASPSPSPASSSAAATQAVLCQDTSAVTGLVIVRAVVRVPQGLQLAFPHQVTVATAAQARAVARALCALPRLPSGVVNCPALLVGTTYQLRFTADGRQLPAVTIESTGCEVVTGVGLARRASTSPGFWRVLATAANLSPPGRSVFSGNSRDPICPPPPGQPDEHNGCPATLQPGGVAVP